VVVRYLTSISGPAARDIQRIWKYLHEQSPSGAKSVRDQILDQISNLELFPRRNIVKAKPGMEPIRSTVVGNYIIYFQVIEKQKLVKILRVRHGAQRKLRRFD
jgi:plasmid stabilization system protein ParE